VGNFVGEEDLMVEEMSWLIGRTESEREIRVYQKVKSVTVNGYSVVDLFQCYAALEAFSLYVVKKYPEDEVFVKVVEKNRDHCVNLILKNLEELKKRFTIITSIDLCNFGRKFLLNIFII
jgi:hypothetical protein